MKAMILAAGLGTRLLPLTASVSKVALSLAGVPVLVRVFRFLRACGVDEFVVNLHHAPGTVRDCLKSCGERAVFSFEDNIRGTAGGLFCAGKNFSGGTFLMVNGDCFYSGCPLDEALEFHRARKAMATMVLVDMPAGESYGEVEIAPDGRLLRIAGQPERKSAPAARSVHFTGIHILEPEILAKLSGGFSDINRDVYPRLIEEGFPLFGFHTAFQWFDLGTPRRFLQAAFTLLETEEKGKDAPAVLLGENCRIDPSAALEGPLEIGPATVIARGSKVKRSVIGSKVSIGPGTLVEESLLGDGVEVTAGSRLSHCTAAEVDGIMEVRPWDRGEEENTRKR